jgi:hypothetical protein
LMAPFKGADGLTSGYPPCKSAVGAGVTIALAIWLLWGRHLPPKESATGILRDIYTLQEWAGSTATIAALGFVAYIAGGTWMWFDTGDRADLPQPRASRSASLLCL